MEIKKGDKFVDIWGENKVCVGFGGNLQHSLRGNGKSIVNEYGISSKVDLIEYIKIRNDVPAMKKFLEQKKEH